MKQRPNARHEAILPFAFWGTRRDRGDEQNGEGRREVLHNPEFNLQSELRKQTVSVERTEKSVDRDNVTSRHFTLRKYLVRREVNF